MKALEEKEQSDQSVDFKIATLNDKLERLNETYKDGTLQQNNQTEFTEIKHYKSATCLQW